MEKQRAPQNRTLQLAPEESSFFEQRLLRINSPVTEQEILDRTINGDLLQTLNFLPVAFADLIIIDPPYNLSKDFAGMKFKAMSDKEYVGYLESWFPKVVNCLKPNGSLYLCGDWKCTAALYDVMNKYLTVLNRITWQREKGKGALHNWKNGMEDIWFGVKNAKDYYFDVDAVKIRRKVLAPYKKDGKPKDWEATAEGNFRMTCPSNFWDDITVPYWSMPENTDHPTQKPEKLIAKLILASCPEGGVVFDPFLGSGTTSVVAKKLGRRYCGIELNTTYACWAEKRLQQAQEDKTIQGYAQGVFWERNSLQAVRSVVTPNKGV
jgi:site-specific DNA-methyltransferase (adenine-specific)